MKHRDRYTQKGECHVKTDIQVKQHVIMKAETRMMCPQAKEHQGLLANIRS